MIRTAMQCHAMMRFISGNPDFFLEHSSLDYPVRNLCGDAFLCLFLHVLSCTEEKVTDFFVRKAAATQPRVCREDERTELSDHSDF